jgi:DNA-directed RNA polymerase subunit RPC12/RpoP
MPEELVPAVDVERQTIRGRVCPACGGKIIPSDRAIYQSTADPGAVFPAWQCERCGYEELSEKKPPAAKPAPKKKVEE